MRTRTGIVFALLLAAGTVALQGSTELPSGATGTQTSLTGLSCVGSSFCEAVGSTTFGSTTSTVTESWNGGTWTSQPQASTASTTAVLSSVSCTSSSQCLAVGQSDLEPLSEEWNGATWLVLSTPELSTSLSSDTLLNGISCTSTSFCVAVGGFSNGRIQGYNRGVIEMWNGASWSLWSTKGFPTGELTSVSCTSSTWCEATGYSGEWHVGTAPDAVRWNGVKWVVQKVPTVPTVNSFEAVLSSVSCTAKTACTAVGHAGHLANPFPTEFDQPLIEQWNGTTWSIQKSIRPAKSARAELTGVSCTSATACEAVGTDLTHGATFSETGTASGWTLQTMITPPTGATLGFGADVCFSATSCLAIDTASTSPTPTSTYSASYSQTWDGTVWSAATNL